MNLTHDLRYAVRKLLKSPGFTAVALLTLALGIGANTAIYSVVDGVLLEPLPYPDADRVVCVWNEWEGSPRANISPAEYFDYRDRVEAFEAFGVYAASSFNMTGGDQPERVRGAFVSAGLYDAFGIEPLLGRVHAPEEDLPGQDDVVVLSHGLWQRAFGGSPDVLGRTITLDGQTRTVVGVMPRSFRLRDYYRDGASDDLFVPLGVDRSSIPNRGSHFLAGVARLAPGVTVAEGTAAVHAVAQRMTLPEATYPDEPDVVRFYDRLLRRVEGLPGVRAAGAVSGLPLATTRGDLNFMVEGRPVPEAAAGPAADWQVVSPGYFEAIGMRLVRGRGIGPEDRADAPGAVVINETMAETYWPGEDPIGQRILLGGGAGPEWPTVVGIVADVRHSGLAAPPRPEMYLPHAQFRLWDSGESIGGMTLAVRTETDPAALSAAVRREVRALDPNLPLTAFRTMDEIAAASIAERRFSMLLMALFAAAALVLAAVGIYGIMAYAVTRRRHEIGIRMALGARRSNVAGMVVRQAGTLALAGIGLGLLVGLAAARLLSSMLYEISPTDPATAAGAAVVLAAVSLLAGYLPARRASRVDPMVALREE